MTTLFQDLRYALRWLARNPGFAAVAILTLALGIGTVTTIFSILDAAVLRPLPYRDPDSLVKLSITHQEGNTPAEPFAWSYPKFESLRRHARSFEAVAAYSTADLNLTGVAEPERLSGEIVSAAYFPVLGVSAVLGRTFTADEDGAPGAHPVALISHGLWQRRFGGVGVDSRPRDLGQPPAADGRRRSARTLRGPRRRGRDLGSHGDGRRIHLPGHPDGGRQPLARSRRTPEARRLPRLGRRRDAGRGKADRGRVPDGSSRRGLGSRRGAPERQPGRPGPEALGPRALRRRHLRSPHRLRERRGPAARARRVARTGGGDPPRDRRRPPAHRPPDADGKRRPRRRGRRRGRPAVPLGRRGPLADRAPLGRRRPVVPVSLRRRRARRPRARLRARRLARSRVSSSGWRPRSTPLGRISAPR